MIEFIDLTKKFGDFTAVNHLNLQVEDGEIFGLIGHNGAGKTTTLRMLTSIMLPTEGEIHINGMLLSQNREEIKRKIGYVSDSPDQFLKLDPYDYWNFIGCVYDIDPDTLKIRIEDLLKTFELTPNGQPIESYSHGMRQKVFVIGALIPNPEIWILDEPLTGLDPQAAFNLKEMMKKHTAAGNTVLFSTHVLEVAEKLCDHIGIMRKGRLIFIGSMDELKAQHPDQSLEEIYLDMVKTYDPVPSGEEASENEIH